MASHARLTAPPPAQPKAWPWHTAKCGVIAASLVFTKDRRLEAETYLSSGFGLRLSIEKRRGWKPLGKLAKVWMPGRLKGIQVSRDYGTPFLAATQVYDIRPIPRKWLALARTSDAAKRFVKQGMILVTCSGTVGRPTVAHAVHEGTLISHDLLRIEPLEERQVGWLYAYLNSPQFRAMATGSHYGHIIKHLEASHMESLPIPQVDGKTAGRFLEMFQRVIALRNAAYNLTIQAEARFSSALGELKVDNWGEKGFTIKASCVLGRHTRLRFDAAAFNPGVAAIWRHLEKNGKGFTAIAKAGYDVWVPGRYKRIPAQDGVLYRDSADLLEVNPDLAKRFADCQFGDKFKGRVRSGWVLIPSSGQVYGIIGTAVLATHALDNQVVSNHVIRIAPQESPTIPVGYLVTALSHLTLGRPLVKALAFGSSVPEIEVTDLAAHRVVRLDPAIENEIDAMAQQAAESRSSADVLEREMGAEAGDIINEFIGGKRLNGSDKDPFQILADSS